MQQSVRDEDNGSWTMGFSVLMSVYQKEKPEYLKEALLSVICQTRVPDEIVLIEDGPLTKELYQVIEEIKNRYLPLKTYQIKENVQLGRALAKGVEICEYELIARMDTDDIAVEKRFEMQYRYMIEHPDIAVTGGFMEEFDEENPAYHKVKTMPEQMSEIRQYAKYRNPLNHMTVMFRKEAVIKAGNYRHFPFLEDYDLWNRMLAQGEEFYNLEEVLVKARTNRELYGRRGGNAYCRQYLYLRRQQRQIGLLGKWDYCMAVLLTIIMTMQPAGIRKMIYQKILRKQ